MALMLHAPALRSHAPAPALRRRCALAMAEPEVDWDSAWQVEQKKIDDGTASWRPEGREPVSEQQKLARNVDRATRDAQASVSQWTGQWQFWLGILAVISVATALLGQGGQESYTV